MELPAGLLASLKLMKGVGGEGEERLGETMTQAGSSGGGGGGLAESWLKGISALLCSRGLRGAPELGAL